MNRPVPRPRQPKIRMKSIAAGTDPGTDHPVIVTTGGKGIIVRKKNRKKQQQLYVAVPAMVAESGIVFSNSVNVKVIMVGVSVNMKIIVTVMVSGEGTIGDMVASVIPVGVVMIVLFKMPVVSMEHGYQILANLTVDFAHVIPAGVAAIVRLKTLAAGMDIGIHGIITEPAGVSVNTAGRGMIVPRIIPVAGMEVGINRGITVPAGVPVIPAGAVLIAL